MLRPLLLSAIAVVGIAQTTSVQLAIQTKGVFRSTRDSASGAGVFFLPTNSFETINFGSQFVYNLGAFNGTPDGSNDQFRLKLYQSIDGGPAEFVGQWIGEIHGNTVRFDHGVLRYSDDCHVYTWRLTQYEFPLVDFTPVNATVTMESLDAVQP